MSNLPLISVIIPTHFGREKHLEQAIKYFLSQTYANRELIVISDEKGTSDDTELKGHRYLTVKCGYQPLKTIGEKRNIGCVNAHGSIIVNADSDDFFAPDYLTKSYEHLISTGADMTGLDNLYFYRPHVTLYEYKYGGKQAYVCGSGAMYYKSVWERNKFQHISKGEDLTFCINAGKIVPHNNKHLMLAMLHGGNTDSQNNIYQFKKADISIAKTILGDNFKKYPL